MPVRIDRVGAWYPDRPFDVTREAVDAYAAATNDPGYGDVAPPLFAIVACWSAVEQCAADVLSADLLVKVVHQAQDTILHRPIRVGDTVVSRGRVSGVVGKARATTLVAHVESRTASGEPVGEFWSTIYIRSGGEPSAGDPPPEFRADRSDEEPFARLEQAIDPDQATRYASASGDHNPIHLSDEAAQAVGFPGVILHGMCTLAFACRAAVDAACGGDPARLRRFAGRFSMPARPGQTLGTSFWRAGPDRFAYESATESATVIRDGLAVVGR